jgi:hypothetical protein
MLAIRLFVALFLSCVASGLAWAESISAADFHSRVVELYSFEPHTLNQAQMQAKSGQLDQFWAMVKADPPNTLPLLRRELETPSNSAFFFFDGSKLLLALSKDRADRTLALRSIAKADLRGIQPTDYVRTVHWLAGEGFDTREAAFRILAHPDIRVFIPQHSLTLGQDYALICMLFAMDEAVFVSDLASRLADESNVQTQKSLLQALWYAVTPAADAAIKAFANSRDHHPEATAYAKTLMDQRAALGSPSSSSLQSLREERRKVMQRPISDEALIEFDELTAKLIAKQ